VANVECYRAPMPVAPLVHTLVDALLHRERTLPGNAVAFRFLVDGEVNGPIELRTNDTLMQRARAVAATLQQRGLVGQRVLLLYAPGLDFIDGFLGCQLAGVVAVPAYPPDLLRAERSLPRLAAMVADCDARAVLTTSMVAEIAASVCAMYPALQAVPWLSTDALSTSDDVLAAQLSHHVVHENDTAFLQYTSGSTSAPKGVVVQHRNIIANVHAMAEIVGDVVEVVSWLPPYHDMGLIGSLLLPLCTNGTCTIMSPLHFLQRPTRWVQAISAFSATMSGGPNFAYDLCARRTRDDDKRGLDLSTWKVAPNGAEPVRAATLARFTDAFSSCGFSSLAHCPGYGLAEATLTVTGVSAHEEPRVLRVDAEALSRGVLSSSSSSSARAQSLVSNGPVRGVGTQVAIVDDAARGVADGVVGNVWVSGPSVCVGYFDKDTGHNAAAFTQRRLDTTDDRLWLATGDLGALVDGELYITGRRKDLLIVNGRNIAPQDVEFVVEQAHAAVRPGGVAAITVLRDDGIEQVGIVAEVRPDGVDAAVVPALLDACRVAFDIAVAAMWLLSPGALPKTSSGKVQRHAARALVDDTAEQHVVLQHWPSKFKPLASRQEFECIDEFDRKRSKTVMAAITNADDAASIVDDDARALEEIVIGAVALTLGVTVDPLTPLVDLGLDSVAVMTIVGELEARLGTAISPALVFEHRTTRALVAALRASASSASSSSFRVSRAAVAESGEHPVWWGEDMLFTLQEQQPQQAGYVLFLPLRAAEVLDAAQLQRAVDAVIARHDVLRTGYRRRGGSVVREVHSVDTTPRCVVHTVDARALSAAEQQQTVDDVATAVRHHHFDLAQPPLLQVRHVQLPSSSVVLLVIHHLIADAWALSVVQRDLETAYRGGALTAPALRMLDHAHSAHARFAEVLEQVARGTSPWPDASTFQLAPAPDVDDEGRPLEASAVRGARHLAWLDPETRTTLEAALKPHGFTLSVAAVAAFSTTLAAMSGASETAFTVVHANRRTPAMQDVVGFCVYGEGYVQPAPSTSGTWLEALSAARDFVLVERSGDQPRTWVQRAAPASRLLLNFHNAALTSSNAAAALFSPAFELTNYPYLWDTHDALVQVFPSSAGGALISTLYRPGVYGRAAVERVVSTFVRALQAMAHAPAASIDLQALATS
jgi:acyl-CoA synthetase (AMP-forming)/AMP-acid ligase II/acyl carrier protein